MLQLPTHSTIIKPPQDTTMVSIDHFRDENMSGSDAPSLYRQQYLEAVQHFKDGKLEK